MTNKDQHKTFEAIIKLYDLAENLLETTSHQTVDDPQKHLEAIEPLIEHIEDAADQLVEEYTALVKDGREFTPESKHTLELSLRKIYSAIDECRKATEDNHD